MTAKNEPSLLTKDALRREHWIVEKESEGERGLKILALRKGGNIGAWEFSLGLLGFFFGGGREGIWVWVRLSFDFRDLNI